MSHVPSGRRRRHARAHTRARRDRRHTCSVAARRILWTGDLSSGSRRPGIHKRCSAPAARALALRAMAARGADLLRARPRRTGGGRDRVRQALRTRRSGWDARAARRSLRMTPARARADSRRSGRPRISPTAPTFSGIRRAEFVVRTCGSVRRLVGRRPRISSRRPGALGREVAALAGGIGRVGDACESAGRRRRSRAGLASGRLAVAAAPDRPLAHAARRASTRLERKASAALMTRGSRRRRATPPRASL